MVHRPVLAAAGLLAAASFAAAADLHVPAQYPTIQAAIAATAPGDRVLVQPGTYAESIDFLGHDIEVIGVGGAAVTTIDATGLDTSCVLFLENEPPTALLQGFTLTGGTGSAPIGGNAGGGLNILSGARPVVRECVITGNTAIYGGGVAVHVLWSDTEAPTFVDCLITGNSSEGAGGGVFIRFTGTTTPEWGDFDGQPVFMGCTISDNVSGTAGGGAAGGGAFIDCWIEGNTADLGGGAYAATWFDGTTLYRNEAEFGGGYFVNGMSLCELSGVALIENVARVRGGGALFEAVEFFSEPEPSFINLSGCVLARNTAGESGDGVYAVGMLGAPSTTTLVNCSLDGDGVVTPDGELVIRSSISRGASPAFSAFGPISVRYSDVEGGWPGTGNIDADPQWVDPPGGDYALAGCSPCIDAGAPLPALDPDGTVVEMGGVSFETWTALGGGVPGVAGAATLSGTGLLLPSMPFSVTLTGAAPSTPVWLVAGATALAAPFKGGTLWPTPGFVVGGLATSPAGSLTLASTWPATIPCGFSLFLQSWWADAGAPQGFAGSNGLRGVTR